MSAAVGYSGTPLPKKLGFKPGQKAVFVGLPADLEWLAQAEDFGSVLRVTEVAELAPPFPIEGGRAGVGGVGSAPPAQAQLAHEPTTGSASTSAETPPSQPFPPRGGRADLVLAFYTAAAKLRADLPVFRQAIQPAGMIWISWPKRSAKVPTDITEDVIRGEALDIGLVDVKVCAVTEVWSGLKLVIPVAQRAGG